jgi:hypothetical protein
VVANTEPAEPGTLAGPVRNAWAGVPRLTELHSREMPYLPPAAKLDWWRGRSRHAAPAAPRNESLPGMANHFAKRSKSISRWYLLHR